MEVKNSLYWSYNLPLQLWPKDSEDEDSGERVLNYMPRKERVEMLNLSEVIGNQTREEYLETAAIHFENLARLFRAAKTNTEEAIYYHDGGMDKD